MPTTRQRASLLFKSGCDKIKAAGSTAEPEDIVWLWESAKKAIEGENGAVPALLDVPVQIGAVTLWPRTIGAALWWEEYGKKWYGGNSAEDEVLALAWMLAHSRDSKLFRRTTCKAVATAHLLAWQLSMAAGVTLNALAFGIQRLFGQFDVDADSGEKIEAASEVDWGAVIAQLCATYHRPPEYYLWEIGEKVALELLSKAPPPPGCSRPSRESQAGFAEFVDVVNAIIAKSKTAKE
jgi:hypothetical protein